MRWIAMHLVVLLIALGGATAQDDDPVISPDLQTQLDSLATYTQRARGLDLTAPLILSFPTRDDLLAYVQGALEEVSDETLAADQTFYAAFGLLPPDVDLRALLMQLYVDQIGGFYDTETKAMNVILISGGELGDRLPLLEQIIYVHEFTHVLQDQNFDLTAYLGDADDLSADEYLARLALVEGDASLVMSLYTTAAAEENPLGTLLQVLFGAATAGNLTLPPDTPRIIERELLFPYEAGLTFAQVLVDRGGFARLDEAFAAPPQTTEQILHPAKYLAGEGPLPVDLAATEGALGADWELLRDGRLGQFYLSEYLQTQLSNVEATLAAEGWGGDAYRLYTNAAGETAWVLRLAWDDAGEADEFNAAYAHFAAARFGLADATLSAETACWSDAAQAICARLADGDTLIATGPTRAAAEALVNSS